MRHGFMENKTILIIEDHLALRLSLSSWLNDLYPQIEIHYASNGEEGLEVADYIKPDIIILDISLPGIGGINVAKCISNRIYKPKIIMLSVFEGSDYANESFASGVHFFINKKSMYQELPETINSIL